MKTIESLEDLTALYETPPMPTSLAKVRDHVTPLYRDWIMASRFCILSTVGPEGTDTSPRGDDGPVVAELDPKTLALPDWKGNNRLDSLRNIVRDGRVSLMFMVPGSANVVRVNGTAVLTDDAALCARFQRASGAAPRSVIVITIGELYFQCAKAIMRSKLWPDAQAPQVPTAGALLKEVDVSFDGETYDRTYPEYAKTRMW